MRAIRGLAAGIAGASLWVALATCVGPGTARAQGDPRSGAATTTEAPDAGAPSAEQAARAAASFDALPGAVDPAIYVLGPGDVLSLEFSGRAARQLTMVIDAEGRANVPELGVIELGGRPLAAARQDILGRLRPLYSGVRVSLRLIRLRVFKVYVAGMVQTPGVTRANGATRASEVLLGPLELLPGASRRNLELRRRSGGTVRVDLDAFAFLGREDDNPFLQDGDVLVVPPRRERVFAYGAFARPGEYERAPGDSLRDLVEIAGGLLPGTDPQSGLLVRFAGPTALDSMRVDLGAILAGTGDRPLADEDRLFARTIPQFKQPRNVTLAGEVMRPGPYAIHEGEDRLSTLLARAGGLTPQAAGSRIEVFRPPANSGQRDIEFERLSRLSRSEMTDAEYQTFKTKLAAQQAAYVVAYRQIEARDAEYDILLRDGDVIVVDRETAAIRIAGEVQRPSLVEYAAGRSGAEYIRLAGGFTERAQRGKVRLTRAGSNQTIYLSEAREIQPGDFIWVPEKRDVQFWSVLKDVILTAGSVATVVILVRGK